MVSEKQQQFLIEALENSLWGTVDGWQKWGEIVTILYYKLHLLFSIWKPCTHKLTSNIHLRSASLPHFTDEKRGPASDESSHTSRRAMNRTFFPLPRLLPSLLSQLGQGLRLEQKQNLLSLSSLPPSERAGANDWPLHVEESLEQDLGEAGLPSALVDI